MIVDSSSMMTLDNEGPLQIHGSTPSNTNGLLNQ